jgi:hypothetical protein
VQKEVALGSCSPTGSAGSGQEGDESARGVSSDYLLRVRQHVAEADVGWRGQCSTGSKAA